MYVCAYVCVYVCVCACMYVCMYVCACVCACMYGCMHVCMYVCVYVCMYACMHACMHECMCVYVHACICKTSLMSATCPSDHILLDFVCFTLHYAISPSFYYFLSVRSRYYHQQFVQKHPQFMLLSYVQRTSFTLHKGRGKIIGLYILNCRLLEMRRKCNTHSELNASRQSPNLNKF
jgi:hypothetical protein